MQAFSKQNKRIIYLLIVIDVFFKLAWIVPAKQKIGQEIPNAFYKIFEERKPTKNG